MKIALQLGHQEKNEQDLNTPDDIAVMVDRFYSSVSSDELLGPIFNDVAKVDWDIHIPKITAFWSRILLSVEGYEGTPIRTHERVNAMHPLTKAHFDRWLELFRATLATQWEGPNARRAIAFAENMARAHGNRLTKNTADADADADAKDL